MDKMVMQKLFSGVYTGKKVFVTGHTGFKGSWLCLWLKEMGATVKGYSLSPQTDPSHWELLKLDMDSVYADIRDADKLFGELSAFRPDIVFHLAAQPLVRQSYRDPVETYQTNVTGTLNLLEACRKTESIRAVVNVTSDKCYENREWIYGYRENDPIGGHDPYSSSKGCSELLTASYRNSFFPPSEYGKTHRLLLASARAGNVIGGGDWAVDRLVPDIMKAAAKGGKALIRNPHATRPWQHVLEPLSGYLLLGEKLLQGKADLAGAWNFGPGDRENLTVSEVAKRLKEKWDRIGLDIKRSGDPLHEAGLLKLDCSKAHSRLNWFPVWEADTVFSKTVEWYVRYYEKRQVQTFADLEGYITAAETKRLTWV